MDAASFHDVIAAIQAGGVTGLLALIIVAISKGWFTPRSYYEEMRRDRDDWKEIALSQTDAADKALNLMERQRRGRAS